jgi:hypothetical protein
VKGGQLSAAHVAATWPPVAAALIRGGPLEENSFRTPRDILFLAYHSTDHPP